MRPAVIFTNPKVGPLVSWPERPFGVRLCETDVEIENLLTFSSTNKEYHLLTSQVDYDYRAWISICSSNVFTLIIISGP